jgi:hypothetical protein
MVEDMNQCRELRNVLISVIENYVRDGGPSDEAILGSIARVLVQCGAAFEVDREVLERLLSEELLGKD